MIAALLLGRAGSVGFPGKNTYKVLGRPMMVYPLLAAMHTEEIDKIYISTDSDEIKNIGRKYDVKIIDRPKHLCTSEAKHQDAMVHGYKYIKSQEHEIEFIVLLQCNAPCIMPSHLSEGINFLRDNPEYNSASTVSEYSAFTPVRARHVKDNGLICNCITLDKTEEISSERDCQGHIYFTDGTFIVRPQCLENIGDGIPPYPWMGRRSYAIKNWGGLDVDEEWQIPQMEYWLKMHGFSSETTPYESSNSEL